VVSGEPGQALVSGLVQQIVLALVHQLVEQGGFHAFTLSPLGPRRDEVTHFSARF
jgi:hypothetical protein